MTTAMEGNAPSSSASTESLDIGACCLCHCSLDFSDRAAFFRDDRHEDYKETQDHDDDDKSSASSSYFFRPEDPYLPESLYDPCNALVYCDTCDRMYHQKCHFVPVLLLPRGPWHCLLCQTRSATTTQQKRPGRGRPTASRTSVSHDPLHACFRSPPHYHTNASVRYLEQHWEAQHAHAKALQWRQQLTRLRQYLQTQLASLRQAEATLETLLSTRRNRHHYVAAVQQPQRKLPQELVQTIVRRCASQWKLREALLNLESVRLSTGRASEMLHQFALEHTAPPHAEFLQRVIFPFGMQHWLQYRRMVPRTPEMGRQSTMVVVVEDPWEGGGEAHGVIPAMVGHPPIPKQVEWEAGDANAALAVEWSAEEPKRTGTRIRQRLPPRTNGEARRGPSHPSKNTSHRHMSGYGDERRDADEDSGISLDDLRCCICLQGHATDDNDLLLCDGRGCYRSYHQDCLVPRPKVDGDEDEDWFCPLCVAIADLISMVQGEVMGDDWEQRRYALAIDRKAVTTDSLKSWEGVEEVFPDSKWEYETACQMRNGVRNADTRRLLAVVLGEDALDPDEQQDKGGSDEEDDEEDFDPEQGDNREPGDTSVDSNDRSCGSLDESSSVELIIEMEEVAALSDAADDSECDDSNEESDSGPSRRRSRRLRRRATSTENSTATLTSTSDQGKIDTANILLGRRTRKSIDYVKLNDAMFGSVSRAVLATIDDADEYRDQGWSNDFSSDDNTSDIGSLNDPTPEKSLASTGSSLGHEEVLDSVPAQISTNRRKDQGSLQPVGRSVRKKSPSLSVPKPSARARPSKPGNQTKRNREGVSSAEKSCRPKRSRNQTVSPSRAAIRQETTSRARSQRRRQRAM